MTTSDWITLSAAGLVVAGWFVTSYFNRRNEIAKVRLKLRTEILLSILDCHTKMRLYSDTHKDNPLNADMILDFYAKLDPLFYLGTHEEKTLCKSISNNLNSRNTVGFMSDLNNLRDLVLKRLKRELKFSK